MLVRPILESVYDDDSGISVLLYIIEHTDPETKIFSRSYSQMEKELHVSSATISRTFKKLSESGVLINTGLGRWYNRIVGRVDDPYEGADVLAEFKGV